METVLLKIPDVMERLSVGQTKVYELMSSGQLRSVKVGRARRVPSDALRPWRTDDGPFLSASPPLDCFGEFRPPGSDHEELSARD